MATLDERRPLWTFYVVKNNVLRIEFIQACLHPNKIKAYKELQTKLGKFDKIGYTKNENFVDVAAEFPNQKQFNSHYVNKYHPEINS